ncbi:Nn.00g092590.m01.CDS01 [Neocucurbitaria sp. VM-36]
MDLSTWAIPQLSKLLPLDDESLKQIVSYTESLPNREAADHLQNLLGDSPPALEFITSFNNRRKPRAGAASSQAQSSNDLSGVPKAKPRKKKQQGLGKLPPQRQPENYGNVSGAYVKKEEEDYMAGSARSKAAKSHMFGLTEKPDASQKPTIVPLSGTATPKSRGVSPAPPVSKLPPSAAGHLVSETKSKDSSPKPKAKVSVAGGTPMHGASTALNDLESAIRALEIQTNPSLAQDNTKRKCNCMATRHPLLEAAPNCLNCGKIICVKEGIGPCTFCNTPLLGSQEIQSMVRVLREERGKEKMAANNASQKRADVSLAPRPFSTPRATTPVSSNPASDVESEPEKLAKAKQHRDKLLAFQAQNAKRTQVHDEAADFETTTAGLSMWASPQERAMQLKRQQKALREQEWNARPEYEKRKVVASIDLSKGRLVRRMAAAERPATPESEDEPIEHTEGPTTYDHGAISSGGGAFSKNPLLGGLIRPTIKVEESKGKEKYGERKQTWRRVQDDNDDNEQWILDGGVYGARADNVGLETDGLR